MFALDKRRRVFPTLVAGVAVLLSACASFSPPTIGSTKVSTIDHMTLVYVPAGSFEMGSQVGLTDERPVHVVTLDAFWIDQTEVTNSMYAQCVQAGNCQEPSVNTYYSDPAYALHPVVYVSWNEAANYCSNMGRRLPTEAEWEKAAAWNPATNAASIYPWGNNFDCHTANLDDETKLDAFVVDGGPSCDGYELSSPVASFPAGASAYGAFDMAGNVWEWVYDGFVETDPFNGSQTYYAMSPAANPTGPEHSAYHVMRGGSWNLNFGLGRSAYRLWFGPDDRYDGVGFRCALGTAPFKLNP